MSNYQGIARDCTITVELTEVQTAAVLKAYDYGFFNLTEDQKHELAIVIAKLKDQIWP